jgi:hypothetical protein
MISWNDAVAQLRVLTDEQKRSLLEPLVETALSHPDLSVRHWLLKVKQAADATDWYERFALLGVARQDSGQFFVRQRQEAKAYRTRNALWAGDAALVANPVTVVLAGKLIIARDVLAGYALENELTNADLLVSKKAFHKLIGHRGGSEVHLKRVGQELINDHVRQGHKLTYKQFCSEMRKHFPGATDARLHTVWKTVIPDAWKSGGRPRKLPS